MGASRSWRAYAAAVIGTFGIYGQLAAAGSVQATQLDVVALPADLKCNRMILKSTEYHKGTAFMMPRVLAHGGIDSTRFYDVISTNKPGKYLLNLRLFFPINDDSVRPYGASSQKVDAEACNKDVLKMAINRDLPEEDKIKRISWAPLTSITVHVKGLSKSAVIGKMTEDEARDNEELDEKQNIKKQQDVDVVDYINKVRTATFEVTEDEVRSFQAQLTDPEGISATIRFRFNSTARDGSVTATLDVKELEKAFSANAKVKNLQKVAAADVEIALRDSLDSRSIRISASAGSEGTQEVMKGMIDKVMNEFSLAVREASANEAVKSGDADDGKVSVAAAVKVIRQLTTRSFKFEAFAVPQVATFDTEIRMRTSTLVDYNIRDVHIEANYRDQSLGVDLQPGQSLGISANSEWTDKIEYIQTKRYMTSSEIGVLGMEIPLIANANLVVTDQEINGVPMAIGKLKMLGGWLGSVKTPSEYRWVIEESFPNRVRTSSRRYSATEDALKSLPVGISFSGLNDRLIIPFSEILQDNDYFRAYFETVTGRLIIYAKRPLGNVVLRELMSAKAGDVEQKPIALTRAWMVQTTMTGKVKTSNPVTLAKDNYAMTKQRIIKLSVFLPSHFSEPAAGDMPPVKSLTPGPGASADALPEYPQIR